MKTKIVDFTNYRRLKLTEIQLTLTENHWGVIVVEIADEITAINKQLATLRNTKNKVMQNQYNYFYRVKEALMNVIEKVESYFYQNKKTITVNFNEFDSIIGTIESHLQNLIFLDTKNTPEYRNLCYVYKALLPIYNKNKSIWEELKSNT